VTIETFKMSFSMYIAKLSTSLPAKKQINIAGVVGDCTCPHCAQKLFIE